MAVANSGGSVLVDSSGVALAGFTNSAASNIKIQDSTIYTITSNAIGSNATGAILLTKASGSVATLDSRHTFVCTSAQISGGTASDNPVSNMALSIKGAKLVFTGAATYSEATAPMVGDAQTQVIYRSTASTWNSAHPGVNLNGSTLVFEAGGDGHLGRHPQATVKNVTLLWKSTTPSSFVLGITQGWGSDNKPSSLDGYRFISVNGNNLVSAFTFNPTQLLPGNFPNNFFFVCRDWTYDVAAVGTQPTALRRSYRRTSATANAGSYWGAVSINATHLHIDLKTTLSASGVLDSTPTYLRTVDYNNVGTTAGDTADDIVAYRFSPTMISPTGAKLANCSIVVLNTNSNCSASNAIGNFRARLSASGSTDSTGQFVITEPTTKDYASNASYRTDSIVIRNRTRTQAWHKWWETAAKLIAVSDSRGSTGTTAPEVYASTDFTVSYRQSGSIFSSVPLSMTGPISSLVTLSIDSNYNSAASTTGIVVTYSDGITTVTPAAGTYTLDQIYKAIIDFHAQPTQNESETVLPVTQNTGALTFGSALVLAVNSTHTLQTGTKCTSLVTTQNISFNGAGQANVDFIYTTANGPSTIWRFESVQVGSSIVVYDASGVTKYFQGSVTSAGDYNYYIPPGTTGTYTWAIEKYGKQRESGTFASNTGGLLFYAPLYVEDVGITETVQATVAAYTAIETASKFYDRTAVFRLTEQGIKLGQIATRSGTAIEIGTFSHVINKDAASVYSVTGSTITTKSTSYAGDSKYATEIATPPATITANSTEVITIAIEDANGNSQLTINGGDGTFQLWKVTTSTPTADYATGTLLATVGNVTYRFIGVSGYDIVGVDTNSNIRRRTSMAKGVYTQAFYVGDQIQLAQAPEVLEILTKVDILQIAVDDLPETIMDTTVETGATVVESLRLHNSVLGGIVSGAGTGTETFRDLADTKDRLISSVDANGNRTAEVADLT